MRSRLFAARAELISKCHPSWGQRKAIWISGLRKGGFQSLAGFISNSLSRAASGPISLSVWWFLATKLWSLQKLETSGMWKKSCLLARTKSLVIDSAGSRTKCSAETQNLHKPCHEGSGGCWEAASGVLGWTSLLLWISPPNSDVFPMRGYTSPAAGLLSEPLGSPGCLGWCLLSISQQQGSKRTSETVIVKCAQQFVPAAVALERLELTSSFPKPAAGLSTSSYQTALGYGKAQSSFNWCVSFCTHVLWVLGSLCPKTLPPPSQLRESAKYQKNGISQQFW